MKIFSLVVGKNYPEADLLVQLLVKRNHNVLFRHQWVDFRMMFDSELAELVDFIFVSSTVIEVDKSLFHTLKLDYPHLKIVVITSDQEASPPPASTTDADLYYLSGLDIENSLATLFDRLLQHDHLPHLLSDSSDKNLDTTSSIIWKSDKMREIFSLVDKVAGLPSTVLITGSSGTGKGMMARHIWRNSNRANRRFYTLDIASIPDNLIESILFGFEKGAFTSAYMKKLGKFEIANGGTLFLDEIGVLKYDLQAKLLRVIQDGEIERIGGTDTINVDVRLIAATNANLVQEVRNGRFREDLFYRLNVIPVKMPALAERKGDIGPLAHHFLGSSNKELGKTATGFSATTLDLLTRYDWPGNVRELENVVARLVAISADNDIINESMLPDEIVNPYIAEGSGDKDIEILSVGLKRAVADFERRFIIMALKAENNNRTRAAERLSIPLSTLKFKLKKHGI